MTFLKLSFMHAFSNCRCLLSVCPTAPQAGKQITAALESGVPPTDALLVQAIADRIAQVCVDCLDGRWMVDGGWWLVDGWWIFDGGWWMMNGGWMDGA